jgi:hypothetical protein
MKTLLLTNLTAGGMSTLLTDAEFKVRFHERRDLDISSLEPGRRLFFAVQGPGVSPSTEYAVRRIEREQPGRAHPADVVFAVLGLGTFLAGVVGLAS